MNGFEPTRTAHWSAIPLIAGLAAVGMVQFAPAQIPCRYEVTVLPNIDCGFGNYPPTVTAVNSHGHVVGWSSLCGPHDQALLWTGGPTWTVLPRPPGVVGARAYDINDKGEIVGYLKASSSDYHPMLFRDGQMIDLGLLSGADYAEALAINNRSQVIGYGNHTGNGPLRAFSWEQGQLNELALPLGPNSVANDIDEDGRITGWMGNHPVIGDASAFIWHDGIAVDLGLPANGCGADARTIVHQGTWVVGTSHFNDGSKFCFDRRAFLWSEGNFQDLGSLPGYPESYGRSVSGSAIVGYCHSDDLPRDAAFIYRNDTMVRLDSLVDTGLQAFFASAMGGNARGQILVDGFFGDAREAALVTPVWAAASDLDANCRTDMNDLLIVVSEWHKTVSLADINHDSIVNVQDLLIVIQEWTFN